MKIAASIDITKGSNTILANLPNGNTVELVFVAEDGEDPMCMDAIVKENGKTKRVEARVFDKGMTHFSSKGEDEKKATVVSILF